MKRSDRMSQTIEEEKRRKKIAVICVICAMAFAAAIVGFGFALNYLGVFDNTSNDSETDYYVVSLDVDKDGTYDEASDYTDAFSGHVYYNTVNSPAGITWTAVGSEEIDGDDCVLLGSVNVKVAGPAGKAAYDNYVLSVTHAAALAGSYKIGVSVDGGSVTYAAYSASAGAGYELNATGAQETVFTIDLYAIVDTPVTSAPAAILYSGETFTFTATATAA